VKSWRSEIEAHVAAWRHRLPGERAWWPQFVYHFTDVNNAASILKSERLYSRARARKLAFMKNENAALVVIDQTVPEHQEFVRLYFRPRTPTQFRNEGIRPYGQRWQGAHCPVPVFLCFDTVELLSQDGVGFSDGNMGRQGTEFGESLSLFRRIRFEDVFHDSSWTLENGARIKNARHSEVLVRDELPLAPGLAMIVCRSSAERQTLLHMLPRTSQVRWEPRMRVDPRFFYRQGVYVESVNVGEETIRFELNPGAPADGLEARFKIVHPKMTRVWNGPLEGHRLILDVPGLPHGDAQLQICDCLAFSGRLFFDDIPF
jgi:hypothetical protein